MTAYLAKSGLNTIVICDFHGETYYLLENIPGQSDQEGIIQINNGYPSRGVGYICDQSGNRVHEKEFDLPSRVSVKVNYLRPRYDNL